MATKPSLALIPSGYKAGKLYSVLPSDGVGDFDFSRSGEATRVNKDGLIELVGSNVPRLNYPIIDGVVSGCPSHILEPQRTNNIIYSQSSLGIEYNNVNSVSDNSGISPDGTNNAIEINANTGNILDSYRQAGLSTITTFSVFLKAGSNDIIEISCLSTGSSSYVGFDLTIGTITYTSGSQYLDSSVVNYGNGWYRCSVTYTSGTSGFINRIKSLSNGTFKLFGLQTEQGSYPTSYIPNYGTSGGVTRSAETCNGAGDAATFNDSEGVLMAEISALTEDSGLSRRITISDGSTNNRVSIELDETEGLIKLFLSGNGTLNQLSENISDIYTPFKILASYKSNSLKLYINGYKVSEDLTIVLPNGLDDLSFDSGTGASTFYGKTKQIQYFDTALTDTDLEGLTSWKSFNEMATDLLYTIQ